MFTWICQKCGKEVPPAYSECPNCAALENKPVSVAPLTQEAPPPPASPAAPSPVVAAPYVPPPLPPQPAARPTNRVAVPAWLVTLLVAAVLIIIGLTLVVLRNSNRTAAAAQSAAKPLEAPGAPVAAAQNGPFRYVEFAGLRLTEDAKQKPFVQMLIVNHSGADLGELNTKINLRAVAQKTQEPVGTFAFKTTLGPYESKEVKAPLDTRLRVYELPDWQFLRAEVQP